MPVRCMMKGTMAGSISPQRVPMGRPSNGVRPMEVSMHLPPRAALTLEPLPRWQVMTRVSSFFMPAATSFSTARPVTYRWEVPWKP